MWVLVIYISGVMTIVGTYTDFGACSRAGIHEVSRYELQGIKATHECRPNRTYRPQR
jgi:hypothetical protein